MFILLECRSVSSIVIVIAIDKCDAHARPTPKWATAHNNDQHTQTFSYQLHVKLLRHGRNAYKIEMNEDRSEWRIIAYCRAVVFGGRIC